MACNHKHCCWFPHNWFCLKGLYWIFVTLFYLTVAVTIYWIYMLSTTPMLTGGAYWQSLVSLLLNSFGVMLLFLTVAGILKALRKIVHAVAPCCCHKDEEKAEVVVTKQEDK